MNFTMKRPLIVFVPNISGDCKCFDQLKVLLKNDPQYKDAFFKDFNYIKPILGKANLDAISNDLSTEIDYCFESELDKNEISEIILVGHSMGTTLLRRAFLNASGFGVSKKLSQNWAKMVSRIILMGAIGRGIDLNNLPFLYKWSIKISLPIFKLSSFGKMGAAILRGSNYISNLRVDWIKFNREVTNQPLIIHLLGSLDHLVKHADVVDIEQFPNAIAIPVPKVGHRSIIYPNENNKNAIIRAFSKNIQKTEDSGVKSNTTKVYFFMHGIRDSRDCFAKVINEIENKYPDAIIINPSYGYLSALGFLFSSFRNSFIPWFIDQFAEEYAQHPKAEFFFAGHSNGTYILGEALKRIPNMAFSRIYLAASVLPPDFQWDDVVKKYNQTKFVRSDMGTEDWPVSVLCRVLNKFGLKSIGPGGADGFEWHDNQYISYNKFSGGHSAMLDEINRQSITNYLLNGSSKKRSANIKYQESTLYNIFKKFGDLLIPLFLLLIISILMYLAFIIGYPNNLYLLLVPVLIILILDRF